MTTGPLQSTLSRAVGFHATHRIHIPEWSEAENRDRFGWTSEAPGHGHHYRVAVTVTGPLDPRLGMVIDLALLDSILEEEIVTPLAGAYLNDAIATGEPNAPTPTCEVMAAWCFIRVARRLPAKVTLVSVRVAEDDTLWADCLGSG